MLNNPEKQECDHRQINGQAFGNSENQLRFDGSQFTLDGYRSTVLAVSSTHRGAEASITDDDVELIANALGLRDVVLMTPKEGHGGVLIESLCRVGN